MRRKRWLAACGGGGAALIAVVAVSALQAREIPSGRFPPSLVMGGIGSFTPAAADPHLAVTLSRSSLTHFRFTPSEASKSSQAITITVRARVNRTLGTTARPVAPPTTAVAPIAYDLGAVANNAGHVDAPGQIESRAIMDAGVAGTSGRKPSGPIKAVTDQPLLNAPHLLANPSNYSIEGSGSYALTRRFAVTTGVRYKSDQDRLPLHDDSDRRSQAVYIGTAFRF